MNSSLEKSMFVLGAGELGIAMLRGLAGRAASAGVAVSVLLRPSTIHSPDVAKQNQLSEIRSLGIELVPGDLADDSDDNLAAVFAQFDIVILCTGFVGRRGAQLKIGRTVLNAGVKRYIPWQFGVNYDLIGRGSAQDLFDEQLDVRDLIRSQSRTEWVIVSSGMFPSFLFEPSFGVVDIEKGVVRALGSWDNAVTVTTAADSGELTTEIVFAKKRISNEIVSIAGETITYGQLARQLQVFFGRSFERVEWTVPSLREALAADPENPLKKYRVVFAEGKGVSWDVIKTFNRQNGLDAQDVESWMRQHLHKP